eukprot:TRINITY_DN18920_c0_g1_i1.p1 TRINITY_DN18920_c0_g1~~TRINITY_DN18920_c0_g1_i1.p1  ORF type:complete len:126 (+),score=23.32 TRINITY_DN18920_c0_g1_i1:33-410(+)
MFSAARRFLSKAPPRPSIVSMHAALGCSVKGGLYQEADKVMEAMQNFGHGKTLRSLALVLGAHAVGGNEPGVEKTAQEIKDMYGEASVSEALNEVLPTMDRGVKNEMIKSDQYTKALKMIRKYEF